MPLYRASLQTLGAIALLVLALACHGKGGGSSNDGSTATIGGTVTYQRVPLAKDANGVPAGLVDATVTTNLVSLPARGVQVRIYQQVAQINSDGSSTTAWTMVASVPTDSTGTYSTTVATGRPTMVEVLGTFYSGGQVIQLIAEPEGISTALPVTDRLQYAMRKAVNGSAPAGVPAPASTFSVNSVVNFSVGLDDEWWLVNPSTAVNTGVATHIEEAVIETTKPGRTPGLGTGSRVLGIGDTIYSFVTNYGSATPGTSLLLHYWPGRSEPGGSYIVYDRSLLLLSRASSSYFGTLRGGPINDDAWDEGVILPLLARNVLYAGQLSRTFAVSLNPLIPPSAPLADLSPDMARIEGLAQAMASNVLKSPYLADTRGTSLAAPVVDVRDISGLTAAQLSPLSAPAIRAFAWEVILKANSLPSPGTSTNWATINPLAAARFFTVPAFGGDLEPINIYTQVTRLKEGKLVAEPVDLAAIFTDSVLTSLGTSFGISWPRPSTGVYTSFISDWGTDPTGPLPPVVLSMAKATQVNTTYPSVTMVYPNVSAAEVFYTQFKVTADTRCVLTAAISPALGPGAQIDVDLPFMSRSFSFTGAGGNTGTVVIPAYNTPPSLHPVRIWLKSPGTSQPDVTVTLTLTPAP